jgi:hypothetical protein
MDGTPQPCKIQLHASISLRLVKRPAATHVLMCFY